ncbi:hypothetical protein FACS189472_14680 [Alphaproteobacteria bacterium]|nr:hypothetical protein FACS189472_14680 [Alphaproteobacteria bacterium]
MVGIWNKIKNFFVNVGKGVKKVAKKVYDAGKTVYNKAKETFQKVIPYFEKFKPAINFISQQTGMPITQIYETINGSFNVIEAMKTKNPGKVQQAIQDTIQKMQDFVKKPYGIEYPGLST